MLLNASVFQEIHSFFLHDHSDRQEIGHDNICNSSSHVHEIEHIALDCSVCDFHFSPSEKVVIFPSRLKHSGTSCTNQQRRVVINFNYIPWRDNKHWQQLMSPEDIKYRQHWEQGMNLPTDSKGVPIK